MEINIKQKVLNKVTLVGLQHVVDDYNGRPYEFYNAYIVYENKDTKYQMEGFYAESCRIGTVNCDLKINNEYYVQFTYNSFNGKSRKLINFEKKVG